jgi:nicotinate phosphoribosyltransferase
MNRLASTYKTSLALLTDLYQLTMAYGYWKLGVQDRQAAFHMYFRKNPFGGGYAVAAGLADVVEYVRDLRFDAEDLDYLAGLKGNDAQLLFESGFIEELGRLRLTCDVDAIPEGTVVFANEPLVRVVGPILQCQLLETPLLNFVNFQTLVATKAARVCHAARASRYSSSDCVVRRESTAASPRRGRRTSAGARRRATSWPGASSASPSAGRTRTVG